MILKTIPPIITDYFDRNVNAIDLFCGVGGLTQGLNQSGINVKLGVDIDKACEFPYVINNKAIFLNKSVEDLYSGEVEAVYPKSGIRLLAGCAPCQTFSKYNQKANPNDRRWRLLDHFSRLIIEIVPELVTMENVPGITNQNVFHSFIENLKRAKYNIEYKTVNCAHYGIPQQRNRLVLLASRFGPIKLLSPKDLAMQPCSVRKAIGHLPPLRAGEICMNDRMHQSSMLSPLNLLRIRSSKPGGSWRDWGADIIASCHKKVSGKSYSSVYGRMDWDSPSPTITTQFYGFGNGRFGHPEQDRAISLREGAILQSFPNDYIFVPDNLPFSKTIIGRLIGNAVPVKLGYVIGKSIIQHINDMD